MRIRALITALAAIAVASIALTGCGSNSNQAYYDTACVDPIAQIRMPDYYCAPGASYHPSWIYYVPSGTYLPGYNSHVNVNHNYYSRPNNATIHTGGLPSSGGKASKYSSGNSYTDKSGKVSLTKPKSNSGGGSGGSGGAKNTNKGSSRIGSVSRGRR